MIPEDFGFGPRQRRLNRLDLMQDVDAIAVLGDHLRDATQLAGDAIEPDNPEALAELRTPQDILRTRENGPKRPAAA